MSVKSISLAVFIAGFVTSIFLHAQEPQVFDYSRLKLVDEIIVGTESETLVMRQFPDDDASVVEELLGRKCRVLKMADEPRYMAFRIGAGKGLKAFGAYVLTIDYPEDLPRSMFIQNHGCETGSGFATGQAVGDSVIGRYVNNNPESLKYPLANEYKRWSQFFYLHERFPEFLRERGARERKSTPEDGFWVFISQVDLNNAPLSEGAAVSRIALYEVENPESYNVKINYPPEELPRRYIFNREEMADGVVSVPHGNDKPQERGFDNPNDWFELKMKNMMFLGMNTFSKDLLEFGHNQGWDAGDDSWVKSSDPKRWGRMLETLSAKYRDLYVLPYYEYGGATGKGAVGRKGIVKPLKNKKNMFSHIEWIEKNTHLDILDPEALDDAKKLLDRTVIDFKDKVNFVGAWFRPRPSQMPISFSDMNLEKYAEETAIKVSREELASDKEKLDAYYKWWFEKRHQFFEALADYMRDNGLGEEAVVLFTADASEPGKSIPGNVIVTDDVKLWSNVFSESPQKRTPVDFEQLVKDNTYGQELLKTVGSSWGEWEWQHSVPNANPANFREKDGTLVSLSFNRLYTVAVPELFDAFRSADGLAIIRHYTLNENMMHDKNNKSIMGYFVSDVDRAGPYCMLAEARAMANGDPRYIGYLNSNSIARGFPQYVRAFNAAFLALPALPSKILGNVSSHPDIVVRAIPTEKHGTYLAVINTGFESRKDVLITIPEFSELTDLVSGAQPDVENGKLKVSMYPGELRALSFK